MADRSRYFEAFFVQSRQEHKAIFDDHVSTDATVFPFCDGGVYSLIADKRIQRSDERFFRL
jgi:hypothetical protein